MSDITFEDCMAKIKEMRAAEVVAEMRAIEPLFKYLASKTPNSQHPRTHIGEATCEVPVTVAEAQKYGVNACAGDQGPERDE